MDEQAFRTMIVKLILSGKTEIALDLLASHYSVDPPEIRVGLPKGHKKNKVGCYSTKERTIFVMNSDTLMEPFIVLHEFYHHIRTNANARHKGAEKYANEFATHFVRAYRATAAGSPGNN